MTVQNALKTFNFEVKAINHDDETDTFAHLGGTVTLTQFERDFGIDEDLCEAKIKKDLIGIVGHDDFFFWIESITEA